MSTGGSIFSTVSLLLGLMILLGLLLYYAVDTRGEVIQTRQAEQTCQQDYAQSSADLNSAQTEIDRLTGEIQEVESQVTDLELSLGAERQGRQRAEAEAVQLHGRIQELEKQLAELRVIYGITTTQIGAQAEQVDQLSVALEETQAQNQMLRQQLDVLEQANPILHLLATWLSWGSQEIAVVGLMTGGLMTCGLTTAAVGLYWRRYRG